ncbi:MAG: leucyl/phenylalanyl-tRNA--protein transferase [Spirochaetes bacterium]|nr:leucyl/phenylalanyl-tRNA--protein transferase [Spirochaetota bacterium]
MFFDGKLSPDDQGMVAVGGRLGTEIILEAYGKGVFPWMKSPEILWYSPNPRMLLFPGEFKLSTSLARLTRRHGFRLAMDTAFESVMKACSGAPRPGQKGTWIDNEFIEAYGELHRLGYGHSLEVWQEDELVGGLYGLSLGRAFFGESMFHRARDASKLALWALTRWALSHGFSFIDCQAYTPHLASLGAKEIPREQFLELLRQALEAPTLKGRWDLDLKAPS